MTVEPIPDDYPRLSPYLRVDDAAGDELLRRAEEMFG